MLRDDLKKIYEKAIHDSLPDSAVKKALSYFKKPKGKVILVAIGKASWQMASVAKQELGDIIDFGVVITKYNHSLGKIDGIEIHEAGHPIPDENSICATKRVLELTKNLTVDDTVLFLVSGGGSSLFEMPRCTQEELKEINKALILCGAPIDEINTVRKHISMVKGGQFATHIYPARVFSVTLSDVIGNDLGVIASGPAHLDLTTKEDALEIIRKYDLPVDENIVIETPKTVKNVENYITGSVSGLCRSAKKQAKELGYETKIVGESLKMEASATGKLIAEIAKENENTSEPLCLIFGGESVVHVKGQGKGGRNQELALSCAQGIQGMKGVAMCSVGSDGTDGPTDAAGAWVDGDTWKNLQKLKKSPEECLKNNDSYNAFCGTEYHIITGPTGTNVNDLMVLLINKSK